MKKTLLLTIFGCLFAFNSFSQLNISLQGSPTIVTSGWTYGSATSPIDSTMRLTSAGSQFGYTYNTTIQNISSCPNFTASFDFKITSTGTPANGFTFFFLTSPITPFSSNSASLGLPNTSASGLALVFDTYDNDANGNNPLCALYGFSSINTYTESNTANLVGTVQSSQTWMTDQQWHHVELTYAAGTLKVYLNHSATPNITGNYTLPSTSGYFGFTSSTNASQYSAHLIKSVTITNKAPIHGTTSICASQSTTLTNAVAGGTWSSNNPTIASVNATTGVVTAGTNSGSATISYTLPSACGSQVSTAVVTVNAIPSVNVITSQTLCNGANTLAVNFTGTPAGTTTFNWVNSNTNIGLAASGTGIIAPFIGTNATLIPISGTVVVTPVSNGCTGSTKSFSYTINPTPTVNTINSQTLCNGSTTTAVSFAGTVTGTIFNWTNNNSSVGLTTLGTGNIPAFTAINTTGANVSATITVTPVVNSCNGTPQTYTYTVKPTPNANNIANQTLCNGVPTNPIIITGTVSGATYNWTNNNTAIGLGATGSGSIPAFTAINTLTTPMYATVTMTPSYNGCTGSPKFFSFTVYPSPSVYNTSNQSICNATASSLVTFDGPITGSTFTWTNNDISIGLGASGSGNINAFTGINNTSSVKTATITVTPWLFSCTGPSKTFTYNIKPTPTVDPVATVNFCNGVQTAPINFTSPVTGTTYVWLNNKPQMGLPISGNGNIPSFMPLDTALSAINASIVVTPTADGCLGVVQSFNVVIHPTPTVNTPISQTICNGLKSKSVNISGNLAYATYKWVTDNTTIGLADTGIGKIFPFVAVNTGNTPEIAHVNITPLANGCYGSPTTFTFTVNPTPVMLPVSNQTVCNNTPTTAVSFSSSVAGTTYAWHNSLNTIGIPDSGVGNIPSFTAINTTINPQTATIAIKPTAATCKGLSEVYKYIINPTPNVEQPLNQAICYGENSKVVNFAGSVYGTTYTWTNNNTIVGLGANGSGNIPAFTGINTDTTAKIATVSITPRANNCNGPVKSFTYTINPLPKPATIDIYPPASMCSNTQYQNFGTLTPLRPDQHYTWSALNGNVMSSGKNHINSLITFPYPANANVILTTTFNATNCSSTSNYNVDVALNHVFVPAMVYHNNYFICLENDADNYYWGYDDKITLDSTLINGEHNQHYYNANPDFNNKYYWSISTKNGCWQKTYHTQPASINNVDNANSYFSIFPNPAEDILKITFINKTPKNANLKIVDIYGKEICNIAVFDKNTEINVKEYAAGIYLVIYTENGIQISTEKFFKK